MKSKEKSFSIKFLKDNIKNINKGFYHRNFTTFLCNKIPELECSDCIFNHPSEGCQGTKYNYDFEAIKNHKFSRYKRNVTIKDLKQFKIS